jgi:hypothetical protein
MPNYLWTFDKTDTTAGRNSANNSGPLVPKLVSSNSNSTFTAPVDVVNDFFWTNSKLGNAGGRQEVPTLILKERTVKTNSFIAQALYSTGAGVDSIKNLSNLLTGNTNGDKSLTQIADLIQNVVGAGNVSTTSTTLQTKTSNTDIIKQRTETVFNQVLKGAQAASDDPGFLIDSWLAPYKGLYFTQPSGWVFYLPFFSNKYQASTNAWNDNSGDSGSGKLLRGITNLDTELSRLLGDLESSGTGNFGTYQEKSKFFQFSKDGDSISVSFPLINAGSAIYDDVLRNWQFIYLLLYNNRPERVNRNLLTPPPIYEAEIPGVRYMPLSYMSNIDIAYVGSRRTMKINIPTGGVINNFSGNNITTFSTIIPEAYQVSITLTSLVSESKNFMYAVAARPNNIIVSSKSASIINTAATQINKLYGGPIANGAVAG